MFLLATSVLLVVKGYFAYQVKGYFTYQVKVIDVLYKKKDVNVIREHFFFFWKF